MRSQTGISRLMAAALVSGGLAAATILASGALRAQTPAPAPPTPAAPTAAPQAPAPAAPPAAASAVPAGMMPATAVPFYAEWASSPHANRKAEPFNHWNKEGAIPVECARCHSTPGFRDYLGADGSTPSRSIVLPRSAPSSPASPATTTRRARSPT